LLDVREALECGAVMLAARRAGKPEIAESKTLCDRFLASAKEAPLLKVERVQGPVIAQYFDWQEQEQEYGESNKSSELAGQRSSFHLNDAAAVGRAC